MRQLDAWPISMARGRCGRGCPCCLAATTSSGVKRWGRSLERAEEGNPRMAVWVVVVAVAERAAAARRAGRVWAKGSKRVEKRSKEKRMRDGGEATANVSGPVKLTSEASQYRAVRATSVCVSMADAIALSHRRSYPRPNGATQPAEFLPPCDAPPAGPAARGWPQLCFYCGTAPAPLPFHRRNGPFRGSAHRYSGTRHISSPREHQDTAHTIMIRFSPLSSRTDASHFAPSTGQNKGMETCSNARPRMTSLLTAATRARACQKVGLSWREDSRAQLVFASHGFPSRVCTWWWCCWCGCAPLAAGAEIR